jgi:hypothetical protein
MASKLLLFATLCVALPLSCMSWWDMGHTVVAEIARLQLDVSTQTLLDLYLGVEAQEYPDMSRLPFCAVWPDYGNTLLLCFLAPM